MHNVQVTPIIGLPQFNGWAQVSTNAAGTVVCAFAVAGLNAGNIGRDLAEKITDLEFGSAAVFHHQLQNLITDIKDKGCELELAVAAIDGVSEEKIALFATYGGQILLRRNLKVGTLLKSDGELKIIQGRNDHDDVYVLASAHAVSFLGEIQQKLIQGFDLDTIVTSVVPAMHSVGDSSLCSLGFVSITAGVARSSVQSPPIPLLADENKDAIEPEVVAESDVPAAAAIIPSTSSAVTAVRTPRTNFTFKFKEILSRVLPLFRQTGNSVLTVKQYLQSLPGRFNKRDVYVSRTATPPWLKLLIPLIVLLLVAGTGYWWWRRGQRLQVQAVVAATAPLEARIAEAQTQVQNNPVQSRDQIAQAVQEMEALAPQFAEQATAQKTLQTHIDQARATYQQVSGREELQALNVFYDFSLIESGFIANRADSNQKQGIFLDLGKRQIIQLDLASKEVKKLPDAGKELTTDVALGESDVFLLAKGLSSLASSGDSQWKSIKEEGDSNREGTLISYFSRYLYILNPAKRNIFRHAPPDSGDTYSDPIGWLKPGKTIPFDQINSWSIDGDMWLGTKDGKVLKLTSGEPAGFEIKGLNEPLSGPLSLYTRENINDLYILEPSNSRLVIVRKSGEFVRQVKSPSIASTTTLVVSEELKKVLLMSGSIIFEVPL